MPEPVNLTQQRRNLVVNLEAATQQRRNLVVNLEVALKITESLLNSSSDVVFPDTFNSTISQIVELCSSYLKEQSGDFKKWDKIKNSVDAVVEGL